MVRSLFYRVTHSSLFHEQIYGETNVQLCPQFHVVGAQNFIKCNKKLYRGNMYVTPRDCNYSFFHPLSNDPFIGQFCRAKQESVLLDGK